TEVAQAALDAGVHILNDVWSGLYDGKMLSLAAERNVPIILMHNQEEAVYQDIKKEVCEFLLERADHALEAGVSKDNIWIDPGFGFA
ncbi:dihydropteroate synthase, partial [Acinetobacter baumannii]